MSALSMILRELDEVAIARNVGLPHDQARNEFQVRSNTVRDYDEFTGLIAAYVRKVHRDCITPGGEPSFADAASRAKEILNQELRRTGGDAVSAYRNCLDGRDSGVRGVLDALADGMKAVAVENYTRHVLDTCLPPDDWPLRVRTVREFIETYRPALQGVDQRYPERYARDVEMLVRAVLQASRQMGAVFRRL